MVIGFTTCDLIDGHEFKIGDNVQFLNNSQGEFREEGDFRDVPIDSI